MKDAVVTCFLACIGAAIAVAAIAADATYLGTWKVSGATAAPWADPKQKPDVGEQTRLIGKAVVFKTREIAGPAPLACKAAHYKEKNYTADMIFQGAFEEMKSKDKSVDPNRIAASLGFILRCSRRTSTRSWACWRSSPLAASSSPSSRFKT